MIFLLFMSVAWAGVVAPNGINDTANIEAELTAKGSVTLQPGGNYKMDCSGVQLKTNNSVIATGANLRFVNAAVANCKMFETVLGAQNILFKGGNLFGTRTAVTWQILLRIDQATNVQVENVTFDGGGTDNIWIGGNTTPSSNFRILNNTLKNARRNALSVTFANKGLIHKNIFEGTSGFGSPEAGIDFEPNPNESVNEMIVTENTFRNNGGPGIYAHPGVGLPGTNYTVSKNVFDGNRKGAIIFSKISKGSIFNNTFRNHVIKTSPTIWIGNSSNDLDIHGNRFESNNYNGIYVQISSQIRLTKNIIYGYAGVLAPADLPYSYGIRVQGILVTAPADDISIRDNDISGVRYSAITTATTKRSKIEYNRISSSGQDGISVSQCVDCAVLNNVITNAGQYAFNVYHDIQLINGSTNSKVYGNSAVGTRTRKALRVLSSTAVSVWGNLLGTADRLEYPVGTWVMP